MTELQMGLIGLGAAAVAGVLAYNAWQDRKARALAEKVMKSRHADVLLDGEPPEAGARSDGDAARAAGGRHEPGFGDEVAAMAGAVAVAVPEDGEALKVRVEPLEDIARDGSLGESGAGIGRAFGEEASEEIQSIAAGEVPAALLDPRTEFIVTLELVEAVPGSAILSSQAAALERVGKRIHWIGFNERSREWEPILDDAHFAYRRLRIGLQLADRRGPLSDADLAVFTGAMQALADELMAVADMPPSRVLDQALELDRFCASVDLEIGVNLVSQGLAFSGTKIRALAEAAGMSLGHDGVFTRRDDDGRVQFHLQNFESTLFAADSIKSLSTHGLTFVLDVPRVDHGERVFHQMVELARRFADTLQGVLVDDNRQPLGEAQIDHIRREFVIKPQAIMAAWGLPAGGPQALRLFA